jgi:CDP-diacylglycerol--serine O-phosphatidyltransferase
MDAWPLNHKGKLVPKSAIYHQMRGAFPSAITLGALAFGFASISFAAAGNVGGATAAIIGAMVLDGLDGRVARAVHAESKFGAELDSLSDVVCFGAAPAFILQKWPLHDAGVLGWSASVALICCCALRLARFNVDPARSGAPAWTSNWFTGVPAPAGALISLLPVYLDRQDVLDISFGGIGAALYIAAVALLMVSKLPTYGPKAPFREMPRAAMVVTAACVLIGLPLLVLEPWLFLALSAASYLFLLPLGWRQYHFLLRRSSKIA